MKKILEMPAVKVVCLYLVLVLSGAAALPSAAQAAFISPSENALAQMDVTSVDGIRAALENELLTERLSALGLSSEEIRARLDSLTVQERQAVMADVGKLQAGGDGVGTLVSLAVLVLIIILIIKLMDKEITIK
ncbi:MAG: PA2779 family protein [bacterium]|nr:PA2779 family protein [bacterium]MDT8396532.1 PA2779 family protein [bacterium]